MYSAVYKCVCKQFGDRLYQDLINHVRTKMAEWSRNLSQVSCQLKLSSVVEPVPN
jgi:hypothetical protein